MPVTKSGGVSLAVAALLVLAGAAALFRMPPAPAHAAGGPVINEFVADHTGIDTNEYVEVFGAPTTDYAALTLLQIEGDTGGIGVIELALPLGTTDAAGYWQTGFVNTLIENGSLSLFLVSGYSGTIGSDLDPNDDGVLNTTPWTELIDTVAVNDGGAGDRTYGSTTLEVDGASRIPNAQDTNAPADWMRNDFDLAGVPGFAGTPSVGEALNTPGAPNQAVTDVPDAPTIVTQPESQTALVGQSVTLSVAATGSAPLSYQWYEGPRGSTIIPVGSNSPSFTTPALSATTTYWVRVSNSGGNADSAAATITVTTAASCAATDTPIGQVQGAGATSPVAGSTVTVQGVVVGDYEGAAGSTLRGFYLQDPGDGDPATSDGIFVFSGSGANRVSLGQVAQVTGTVGEFAFGATGGTQTQLTGPTVELCGAGGAVTPVELSLPLASAGALEAYEGMLVRFSQTLYVTEHFQLGRFGQVVLSAGGRLRQPTAIAAPGAAAATIQAANELNKLFLDDGSYVQNPDPIVYARGGQPLSASNTLRGGDTLAGVAGVLAQTDAASLNTASDPVRYRLLPIGALGGGVPSFVAVDERPAAPPAVGGSLKVAATNVLNYFLTLDTTEGTGPCGPAGTLECRGANTAEERTRQRDKLLQALKALDADILGLVELENTTGVDPVGDLVSGLNALTAPGTYAAIATGTIGGDAIKVGLIYKPAVVTPVGAFEILDSSDDSRFIDTKSRPVLAQSFREQATGEEFAVAIAHLKSKSSACDDVGDPDAGDGQGNCNRTRAAAAEALVDWLAATFADPDLLIVGDLNAYAQEDPVAAVLAGADGTAGTADDYVNLIQSYGGAEAYSFVFDGQWGYLDHALASASLVAQVRGVAEWHVNADEPNVLDYNTDFKSPGQVSGLYAADPFRYADHDPVLVGLQLGSRARVYLPLLRR